MKNALRVGEIVTRRDGRIIGRVLEIRPVAQKDVLIAARDGLEYWLEGTGLKALERGGNYGRV
jgi:hypothetical protein